MPGSTNSELRTMCKALQTKKTASKCQKNQEADSVISEGTRQKQALMLWNTLVHGCLFFLVAPEMIL